MSPYSDYSVKTFPYIPFQAVVIPLLLTMVMLPSLKQPQAQQQITLVTPLLCYLMGTMGFAPAKRLGCGEMLPFVVSNAVFFIAC